MDGEQLLAPVSSIRDLHASIDGEDTCSNRTLNGDGEDRDEDDDDNNGDGVEEGNALSSIHKSKPRRLCFALMSRELVQLLNSLQGATLEEKLRNIGREKAELAAEIEQLKKELEDEKQKNIQLQGMCQLYNNYSANGSEGEQFQAQSKLFPLFFFIFFC